MQQSAISHSTAKVKRLQVLIGCKFTTFIPFSHHFAPPDPNFFSFVTPNGRFIIPSTFFVKKHWLPPAYLRKECYICMGEKSQTKYQT